MVENISSLLRHPPVAGGNANKDQNPAGKQQGNPAVQGREPAVPKVNNGFIEVEPVPWGFTECQRQRLVCLRCPERLQE